VTRTPWFGPVCHWSRGDGRRRVSAGQGSISSTCATLRTADRPTH